MDTYNHHELLGGSESSSIKSFELYIKVLPNSNDSAPASTTTSTVATTSTPSDSTSTPYALTTVETLVRNKYNSFYRLNVESAAKFIELKRKIAIITDIFANNQEWYIYQLDYNNDGDGDGVGGGEKAASTSTDYITNLANSINPSMCSIETLIAEEKLFNIPLTLIIEEKSSLEHMCIYTDDLIRSACDFTKSSRINERSAVKMLFVVVNKSTTAQRSNDLAAEYMGIIEDDDIQIDEDVEIVHVLQPVPRVAAPAVSDTSNSSQTQRLADSSIDITHQESVEELVEVGAGIARHATQKAHGDDDEDEVVIEEEDNYEVIEPSVENEDDEDDDDDVDFLADEQETRAQRNKKHKGLISTICPPEDEFGCTSSFVDEFVTRYGPLVPVFYIGKLEAALREALHCSTKDRKIFGVYLHSDDTIFAHIFCKNTLCDENVVNFLTSNFIIWPWDLTLKPFEDSFYQISSRVLSNGANSAHNSVITTLKELKDRLPLLLIITRSRGNNEISAIIEGDCSNEMLMNRLMQACELFEMQRLKDERDEANRDEREKIKREQDAAYQASLELDKAKRQKQTEDLEKEKEKGRQLEQRKVDAKNSLPIEPADNETVQVSRIRFRLPSGEFLQRKFFVSNKLKCLIDFVTSHGYLGENYKLLSSWPRRDLTTESTEKTLEELKLFPQETLTLEER